MSGSWPSPEEDWKPMEAVRHYLEQSLGRLLDQQKFAEAKNALLATVGGAAGSAMITAFAIRASSLPSVQARYVLIPASIFLLAAAISFCSFLPRLKNSVREKPVLRGDENVIFFGDLAKFTEIALIEKVCKLFGAETSGWTEYERSLVNQIIVNAEIVDKKFRFFAVASFVLLVGVLVCIAMTLFEFWHHPLSSSTKS